MKRTIIVLSSLGAIFLLLFIAIAFAFDLYFGVAHKAEIIDTWETADAPFKVRIDKHIERGGFAGFLNGAYFDFQSAAIGSDEWNKVMSFRHDDPIDIPKTNVRFASDGVAYVFMGWMYAVTVDGGKTWSVAKMWDFLSKDERCVYNCIKDLRIGATGIGEIELNIIGTPDKVKLLRTTDFGKSWYDK